MRKFIVGLVLLLGMTVMMGFSSHTDPPKDSKAIVTCVQSPQLEVQTILSDFSFDVGTIQNDDGSGGFGEINSFEKSKQRLIIENEILKKELTKFNFKVITLQKNNTVLQYQIHTYRKPRDGISCN